jgi:hypothetical protein
MNSKRKSIFPNFYPLGLLCFGWGAIGFKWKQMTPSMLVVVALIVITIFIGDIGFFGSVKLGFITIGILSMLAASSFMLQTGPWLLTDSSGAFMLGVAVSIEWAGLVSLLKAKGLENGIPDD